MATTSPMRSSLSRLSIPEARAADLHIAWEAIRAAGHYVQQLDEVAVPYDRWGHAYSGAESVLEASISRVQGWTGSRSPAPTEALQGLRDVLIAWQGHALDSLRELRFGQCQAALMAAGTIILSWCWAAEVEVQP